MQLRCYQCHTPFAINKDTVRVALDMLHEEGLSHYNAQCPRCRRANRVSIDQLKRAAPDWSPSSESAPEEPTEEETTEE
jgi:hypothetical protein